MIISGRFSPRPAMLLPFFEDLENFLDNGESYSIRTPNLAIPNPVRINPITLRFRAAEHESAYAEKFSQRTLQMRRITITLWLLQVLVSETHEYV